jgi:hypothetical protein
VFERSRLVIRHSGFVIDSSFALFRFEQGRHSFDIRDPTFDIPVPRKGQALTFRKAGGDPQLTLRIHSRDATQTRRRVLWSLVWATFGIVAVLAIRRSTSARITRES